MGNTGPCIADNGAVIVNSNDGSTMWDANLPNEEANQIISLVKKFKLYRASCDNGGIDNPIQIPKTSKVRKISIHDITPKEAEDIIAEVSLKYKDVIGVKAASYRGQQLTDVYFSNILASKQHAVFELSKILGITEAQIIGVGDGYNDYPLLMSCGLKVAMGNAVDELKDIADYIAPSVDNDGLAEVIDRYYLNLL